MIELTRRGIYLVNIDASLGSELYQEMRKLFEAIAKKENMKFIVTTGVTNITPLSKAELMKYLEISHGK